MGIWNIEQEIEEEENKKWTQGPQKPKTKFERILQKYGAREVDMSPTPQRSDGRMSVHGGPGGAPQPPGQTPVVSQPRTMGPGVADSWTTGGSPSPQQPPQNSKWGSFGRNPGGFNSKKTEDEEMIWELLSRADRGGY